MTYSTCSTADAEGKLIEIVCAGCRWFDPDKSGKTGLCRRHAPTMRFETEVNAYGEKYMHSDSYWPRVDDDDWCGEFTFK